MRLGQDLKVVIMSATMDVTVFKKYFEEGCRVAGSAISIGMQPYAATSVFLDDLDGETLGIQSPGSFQKSCEVSVASMQSGQVPDWTKGSMYKILIPIIEAVATPGNAVLVFLPGSAEILHAIRCLQRTNDTISIHILHSKVPAQDQTEACATVPDVEKRVIFATSLAESSVTIPSVSHVIDTGISRDMETEDLTGLSVLCDTWSAQAVVRQRAGRAGRTRSGMNIRLFSRHVYESYMREWRQAGWTVDSVAVAILSLKTRFREFLVGVPVERVLKEMLVPPGAGLVVTALGQLCGAGLLQKSSSDPLPRPQRPADKEDHGESSDDGGQDVATDDGLM
jgi:HrpA-like RNA helicase